MLQLETGDIVIRVVGNGYLVMRVVSAGGLNEMHVARSGDGGADLTNLVKQLIVTDRVTG